MADTIDIALKEYADIKDEWIFWKGRFPVLDMAYSKGKNPLVYIIEADYDTATATNLTDTTDPADLVLNFTTPQQVYIRSSNAADTDKSVTWIGQKADGSFGSYSFDTDGTDGTTAVDCGTWNFIMQPTDADTFAGNLIIDDDGLSTTVFWTMALGAVPTTGIVVVPDGYKGTLLQGKAHLTAEPGTPASDGMKFSVGSWDGHLNQYHPYECQGGCNVAAPQAQISFKAAFINVVTPMDLHAVIMVWEE